LTARLDLAEITEPPDGTQPTAVPVEYRKGGPRHVPMAGDHDVPEEEEPGQEPLQHIEPWPTDRVQVGLQVLLLEEHGYRVPHAVLYYAAEKRRLVVTVDPSLRDTALAELAAAERTAAGQRPLPLVDDPRCPRCSLQPICLPDEVNHQRLASSMGREGSVAGDSLPSPRRMWPPRDDGLHVVAQREGVRVGIRGGSLRFTDREGATVRDMPLAGVEGLAVVGRVQVSTDAVHALADRDIPVVFMTAAGRTVATVDPLGPLSAAARRAQVLELSRPVRCLELARALIAAKISNQRTLLLRNAQDLPRSVAKEMGRQAEKARVAGTLESLLGHEGIAARHYFQWFPTMLRDAKLRGRFQAAGRARRPPPDPVNAVLSFGYAMLVHECTSALRLASLDPAIGGYHQPRAGRPALALDLMEPFRPLIADSVAISMFNRGEIGVGHFLDTAAGCAMTDHGRRAFFKAWGRRMATVVAHPVFEYRLEYRRMLMLHARLISAWLQGEAPTLAFLTTR
jgi:CRISPR-associated protein Cas1